MAVSERSEFFTYAATVSLLAAAGNATSIISIEASSDFVLQKLSFFADIAAAAQTQSTQVLPLIRLQITDTGSSTTLFNQAVPIPAVFGTGQIPFILPVPRRFRANS